MGICEAFHMFTPTYLNLGMPLEMVSILYKYYIS